jgi:UDP-N-acetylmuramoyl-tripeptide--D-alanyl-D-alanine ligase
MKALTIEEIRDAVQGRWLARGGTLNVRGVSTDTRTAKAGEVFFALRGENFDGHKFLPAAAKAGCPAAVVCRDAEVPDEARAAFPGGLIAVADTTRALGDLAAYHRRRINATVIGVTGSNGKTTVKRMIHHILSRRLTGTCGTKSFNNNVGLPLTLLAASPGDDYVVCELGTNAPGEIAGLAQIAAPDLAVITCIAPAHLERLGSIERIAVEKASILGSVPERGLGVIWGDSEVLLKAVRPYPRRVVLFGESATADLRLTGQEPHGRAQRFQVNGRLWVDLPLAGRHNAVNALAAIAVAQRFGIAQDASAAALADFVNEGMRLEWTELPGGVLINDAYNANPSSLAAAADVLAGAACPEGTRRGRKVLVVGDMRELGEQSESIHQAAGAALGGRGIDLVISVGALGRCLAQAAQQAGVAAEAFDTSAQAAAAMGGLLRTGDTVLVKASRAMAMEDLLGPIRAALGDSSEAKETEKESPQTCLPAASRQGLRDAEKEREY